MLRLKRESRTGVVTLILSPKNRPGSLPFSFLVALGIHALVVFGVQITGLVPNPCSWSFSPVAVKADPSHLAQAMVSDDLGTFRFLQPTLSSPKLPLQDTDD